MKYKTNVLESTWRGSSVRPSMSSEVGIRIVSSFTNEMPSVVPAVPIDSIVMDAVLSDTYATDISCGDREFYKAVKNGPAWLYNENIKFDHEGLLCCIVILICLQYLCLSHQS